MRGSDLADRLQPMLTALETLTRLLPIRVAGVAFELCRHVPTPLGFGMRYVLLRRLASRCGKVVAVYPGAYFIGLQGLEVGDYVSIHQMSYLECSGGLHIGNHVSIAHGVSLITLEHDYMQSEVTIRDAPVLLRPIKIENNVWIAAGARVLGGITIGAGSVIAAGAVVTKDVPNGSIVAGVPARVIATREPGRNVAWQSSAN